MFSKHIRGHFNVQNVTRFTFTKQLFFSFFSFVAEKSPVPKQHLVFDFITCRNVVQKLKKI